jgi:hypothetical protein
VHALNKKSVQLQFLSRTTALCAEIVAKPSSVFIITGHVSYVSARARSMHDASTAMRM